MPARHIKLSAQEQMLNGATLIEKWEFAQAVGFDGIELRGGGGGSFRERLPELRAARDAGVPMPTVCVLMDHFLGDFDADRRRSAIDGMKELLSVIREAGGFGAITPAAFGLFSRALPPFAPPRSREEDRELILAGLTELGEHAAGEGAVLLLEPLNRYEDHMVNTLATAVSYCKEVGLDSVRVIGDFFHMNIEELDIPASLREAAPYIAHMQLGDSSRLEPGTGHVDFASAIDVLTECGYEGWYAMECGLSGDPASVLPAVSAYLRG
jgi:sugar phosphate isomerase/epimerase